MKLFSFIQNQQIRVNKKLLEMNQTKILNFQNGIMKTEVPIEKAGDVPLHVLFLLKKLLHLHFLTNETNNNQLHTALLGHKYEN